eukprot:52163-Amphidinium_carterae.1
MGSVNISREFMTIPSRAMRRSPLPMMEKWTPRSLHWTAQQIKSSLSQTSYTKQGARVSKYTEPKGHWLPALHALAKTRPQAITSK